ncbi:MAG: hypothetical protein WEB93_04040, partial [Sphingomonadales bacterium]
MSGNRSADPEGKRLPIKLDTTSNGEFEPIPLAPVHRHANDLAHRAASDNARRKGQGRRQFLLGSCGAASTLLAFNAAYAATGKTGGFYELAADTALDDELATAAVDGNEFIFDVQGHFVNPTGDWTKVTPERALSLGRMVSNGNERCG